MSLNIYWPGQWLVLEIFWLFCWRNINVCAPLQRCQWIKNVSYCESDFWIYFYWNNTSTDGSTQIKNLYPHFNHAYTINKVAWKKHQRRVKTYPNVCKRLSTLCLKCFFSLHENKKKHFQIKSIVFDEGLPLPKTENLQRIIERGWMSFI